MGHLAGLKDYLDTRYKRSVFDQACASHTLWTLHLHGQRMVQASIVENHTYDLTINLKGGLPVIILRHSMYDARDKTGRCLLKTFQDEHQDWQKSPLFVPS